MSEQKTLATLKALSAAVLELSDQVNLIRDASNKALAQLSQTIGNVQENLMVGDGVNRQTATFVAQQIQSIFANGVMLDQISAALLTRQLNALRSVASSSDQRAPQLLLLKDYVPGAQRARLTETGDLSVEQQVNGAVDQYNGWETDDAIMGNPDAVESFKQFLAAEGVEAGIYYYLIDDISYQKFREGLVNQSGVDVEAAQREAALRAADQAPQVAEAGFEAFEEPEQIPTKAEDQPVISAIDNLRNIIGQLDE